MRRRRSRLSWQVQAVILWLLAAAVLIEGYRTMGGVGWWGSVGKRSSFGVQIFQRQLFIGRINAEVVPDDSSPIAFKSYNWVSFDNGRKGVALVFMSKPAEWPAKLPWAGKSLSAEIISGNSDGSTKYDARVFSTGVSIWTNWLVLAAAVGAVHAHYRARRTPKFLGEGQCRQCGYDIRATPARCPECGAVVAVSVV